MSPMPLHWRAPDELGADAARRLTALNAEGWTRAARHGDAPRWRKALAGLPDASARLAVREGAVALRGALAEADAARLEPALRALHPWRKGPFDFFGLRVDAEWRSDMKWNRIAPHLGALEGCRVLDVGCGNGYFLWRLRDAGARFCLGVDPVALYAHQFAAVWRYLRDPDVMLIPGGFEELARRPVRFERVLSMGVLYHRRSPIEHLQALRAHLSDDGLLVLETLVVRGKADACLVPPGRYAKMRNVWFIPSPGMLEIWLKRSGFSKVDIVDITPTTPAEQRRTPWMRFESLADFLDPDDSSRTIEGHPAPLRAVTIARP